MNRLIYRDQKKVIKNKILTSGYNLGSFCFFSETNCIKFKRISYDKISIKNLTI